MAGSFSPSALPTRPGGYFNFVVDQTAAVLPGYGGVVHIPIVADWGPIGQVLTFTSFSDFQSVFGTNPTDGSRAVAQAFRGEGTADARGASAVQVVRMAGTTAANATVSLSNTSSATALTLNGLFKGTRANTLKAAVTANAADATKNDLVVYDGATVVERYPHVKANVAALAASINASSRYVTATSVVDGTPLNVAAATALTGGDSGLTLTAAAWTTWMTQAAGARFSVAAPYDLTDQTIAASLVAWIQNRNANGKRSFLILGGPAGETISTALSRTLAYSEPNVLSIGGQDYVEDGNARSSSQMVPRLAGVVAGRGDGASLTYARLQGASVTSVPSPSDVSAAITGGLLIADTDTDPVAPTYFVKAVTSYTTTTDTNRPIGVYGNPKFVRTMQLLEVAFTELVEQRYLGKRTVDAQLKGDLITAFLGLLAAAQARSAIQLGYTADFDTTVPVSVTDDFVAVKYSIVFSRSLERVFGTVHVR